MPKLSNELKKSIGEFCQLAYENIRETSPKRRSIIIQFNKDKVYVGGMDKGLYKSLYYDPNGEVDEELDKIVKENISVMTDCKNIIDENYPKNRMRSFNIFYNDANKEINVCKNMIGNRGIRSCRLFNLFKSQ